MGCREPVSVGGGCERVVPPGEVCICRGFGSSGEDCEIPRVFSSPSDGSGSGVGGNWTVVLPPPKPPVPWLIVEGKFTEESCEILFTVLGDQVGHIFR